MNYAVIIIRTPLRALFYAACRAAFFARGLFEHFWVGFIVRFGVLGELFFTSYF